MTESTFTATHRQRHSSQDYRALAIVSAKTRGEHVVVFENAAGSVFTSPVFSFLWQFRPLTDHDAVLDLIPTAEVAPIG